MEKEKIDQVFNDVVSLNGIIETRAKEKARAEGFDIRGVFVEAVDIRQGMVEVRLEEMSSSEPEKWSVELTSEEIAMAQEEWTSRLEAITSERLAREQKKKEEARERQLADFRSRKEWIEREINKLESL